MESLELENSWMKGKLEEAHQSIVASNAQKHQLVDQLQDSTLARKKYQDLCLTLQLQIREVSQGVAFYEEYISESRRENILQHISSHIDSVRPRGIAACSSLAEERARQGAGYSHADGGDTNHFLKPETMFFGKGVHT